MRSGYKLLSLLGDVKAATRGPGALLRRWARKRANRTTGRLSRRILKP